MGKCLEFPTLTRSRWRVSPLLSAIAAGVILFFVHDIVALANLYAVGFIGAIATNLWANASTALPIIKTKQVVMWGTFLIFGLLK